MRIRTVVVNAIVVALVAGATLVLAEARGSGPGGPGEQMMSGPRAALGPLGRMLDRLDLSDEQKAKVEAILDEARPGIESLREKLRDGRRAFASAHPPETFDEAAVRAYAAEQNKIRTELAVLEGKTRARVLAVLTPEQLAEFKAMHERFEDYREEFGPGMGHRGGRGQRGW